jgi:hypothetical protein
MRSRREILSALTTLQGEMHGRHYQRLGEESGNLLVRPTIDRQFRAGDFSAISDQRDNVHWFVTTSARAYTLDAIVDNLDPSRPYRFRTTSSIRRRPRPGAAVRCACRGSSWTSASSATAEGR